MLSFLNDFKDKSILFVHMHFSILASTGPHHWCFISYDFFPYGFLLLPVIVTGRRQSKMLWAVNERGSKTLFLDFLSTCADSINVFDCRPPRVVMIYLFVYWVILHAFMSSACLLGNFACFYVFSYFFFFFFFSKYSFGIAINGKQFGSRSGPTFCWAWSASKLFEKVISRQHL